jgi:hypothetical protein
LSTQEAIKKSSNEARKRMMTPKRMAVFLMLAVIAAFASPAAIAAPKALYGKSIIVSWTEQRVQRRLGESTFHAATRIGTFSVYVSTQGHLFNRSAMANPAARHGRGREGSKERVGSQGHTRISFQGRSLVAIQMQEHGARRILVTFDAGFTSCTANVIRGKETGAQSIRTNSLIRPGAQAEIQSVTTSGVSCSMRDGNVFSGG